ncbi:MAG: SpoIIE family protein phosphatase [SAR324 cluster bacterium]|nr:SpoIIE family protein phosphatase [SAR324 cluster bacterium]
MSPLKLRHKVNGAILVTFLSIAVIFSIIQLPFQQRRFQTVLNKIEVLLQTVVERDQDRFANEIFEGRLKAVKLRVQALLKVPGIKTIYVYDAQGKLLVYEGLNALYENLKPADIQKFTTGHYLEIDKSGAEPHLHYLQDIRAIGERIGFIQITYALGDVSWEQQLSFILFGALLCSILLLMLFLLNMILLRTIIHPISYLDKTMKSMTPGELGVKVMVRSDDEIGELSRHFNQMSAELASSYFQIEQQNKELKRLDQLKDEFLANTSHELRTPLNGIIGLSESLLDGIGGAVTPIQYHNLSMIMQSGKRLSHLVNDILDFSRMKQNDLQLQLKTLDIKSVLDVALTLCQPMTLNKSLELVDQLPHNLPRVLADENRLEQILMNLLGNAIKFTTTGTITIHSRVDASHLWIFVTDTGIGIPKSKLESIFKSFEQADGSIARIFGGSGLGLTISRQLVELHGGQIKVESREGEGSTFSFSLPITSRQELAEPSVLIDEKHNYLAEITLQEGSLEALPATLNPLEQQKPLSSILVVDDEPVNLQVIVNQLTMQNYLVYTATSGMEALDLIKNTQLDLILLDVMMPHMSGFEVCRRIRSLYSPNELPVIFLTAKNQVHDLIEGFNAGANDYISKPFVKNELFARVQMHIRLAEMSIAMVEKGRMETELKMASTMQKLLYPQKFPVIPTMDIDGLIHPATETGGDWYGFMTLQNHLYILIGDVSGHGSPSALITAMAYGAIRQFEATARQTNSLYKPSELNCQLNSIMHKTLPDDYFMTFFIARIDLETGLMTYSHAGHPYPQLVRQQKLMPLPRNMPGPFLGINPHMEYCDETLQLQEDDLLFFFTDGLIEIHQNGHILFGETELRDCLLAHQQMPPKVLIDTIFQKILSICSKDQFNDDITMIACKIKTGFPLMALP